MNNSIEKIGTVILLSILCVVIFTSCNDESKYVQSKTPLGESAASSFAPSTSQYVMGDESENQSILDNLEQQFQSGYSELQEGSNS